MSPRSVSTRLLTRILASALSFGLIMKSTQELTGSSKLGTEAEQARTKLRQELAETICFSLYGSMHTCSERALFRTALQEAIFAEAKASGVGAAAALLSSAAAAQQGNPSANSQLDSSGAVPFFLSRERRESSFSLQLLRMSLQRHSAEFLACMFQEPLAAMLQHSQDLDLRTPDSPLDGPDSPHKLQRKNKLSLVKRSRSRTNLRASRASAADRSNSNPGSRKSSMRGSVSRQSVSGKPSSTQPKSSRFSRAVTWVGVVTLQPVRYVRCALSADN